ncbi:MAG: glucose-1-phosphate cytidylyltransferase [Anaerolineae bacterium]|nr:glucose-1-phosphate cytidylyltransferase [Thermoflexales bacterium]MDW8394907.1 glucose-1-phosphate cytidylyltransferase [Anaerolineae bacterium]
MRVVILAGGFGTRLAEETVVRPKPMVEIGGLPILVHIMRWYACFGFKEFVIALGYKGEVIKQYFLNYYALNSNVTVQLHTGQVTVHETHRDDWTVHLVDTGLSTMTGGRLKRLKPWLGNGVFMMTYGDGVSDVDIRRLVEFHHSHGKLATVTAARPPARFGDLKIEGDQVTRFAEKPQAGGGWINAGFFVLHPRVLDFIEGDETIWERDPLERLVATGELMAYRHEGFWQPMDTLREKQYLEELWQSGKAPWRAMC